MRVSEIASGMDANTTLLQQLLFSLERKGKVVGGSFFSPIYDSMYIAPTYYWFGHGENRTNINGFKGQRRAASSGRCYHFRANSKGWVQQSHNNWK